MLAENPLYTIKEVAGILRISLSNAYALVQSGQLACLRVGRHGGSIRVRASDLQRYLAACETTSSALEPPSPSVNRIAKPQLKHLKV